MNYLFPPETLTIKKSQTSLWIEAKQERSKVTLKHKNNAIYPQKIYHFFSEHCDESKCPDSAILSEDCKCWCNTGNPSMPVVEWDGRGECLGLDASTGNVKSINKE